MSDKTNRIWQGWTPGEYQVHFIHTGVCESALHIFPDGTTMLLDCGDMAALTRQELAVPVVPNASRMAGEWIARYVRRVLPADTPHRNGLPLIDYMFLSHFHDDHCGSILWQTADLNGHPLPGCYRSGLALAAEQLAFDTAIDRGWPDYSDRPPMSDAARELGHMKLLYKALQDRDNTRIEPFRLGSTDQIVLRHAPEKFGDFKITNITANGRILCKDGSIRDLYEERLKLNNGYVNENAMSLGIIVNYGKFSLFTAGDFADRWITRDDKLMVIEDELARELPGGVDVAKINHHGCHSTPPAIVSKLAPQIWTCGVWDQLHLMDFVMERLADRSLYPGDRMIIPTVYTEEHCKQFADRPFMKDIAPEVKGTGAHVVITVSPGGRTFRVTCIAATDESMRITGEYSFTSKNA